MSHWQVCPLVPTGYGDSPYQNPSSFAGNQYFIDLWEFVDLGLLAPNDLKGLAELSNSYVDFGNLYQRFWPILRMAFDNFLRTGSHFGEFENYCDSSAWWLDDYSLFMAIKDECGGKQWVDWPKQFIDVERARTLCHADGTLGRSMKFHRFIQWTFHRQWKKLKNFAAQNGISIIGDIPIFVGFDSADVWANKKLFKLREDGSARVIAGVPPDAFSATGQLWGNPIYDWEKLEADDFAWWKARIRRCIELYDVIRIDHFRGFCDYWEVPAPATDATAGKWVKSIGIKFFQRMEEVFPGVKFIAEDLGMLNEKVEKLLDDSGLPGMSVLEFAFDGNNKNKYLPHNHHKNSVLYIGTHDNDTARGWYDSLPPNTSHQVRCYLRVSGVDIAWDLIRKGYESPANLFVLTMQDILNLGSEARFNTPSTTSGNWQWRMTPEQLGGLYDVGAEKYLYFLKNLYDR
jgi:4-alpha-glucanotransferase